jgi:hypothetical protein
MLDEGGRKILMMKVQLLAHAPGVTAEYEITSHEYMYSNSQAFISCLAHRLVLMPFRVLPQARLVQ